MPDLTPKNLNQVFRIGMSKEEFISNYQQLASSSDNLSVEESVFFDDIPENTIGLVFDSINLSNEGTLTESDINALSALDGNAEDISVEDIKMVYTKLAENLSSTPVSIASTDSDTQSFTPSEKLDGLQALKGLLINLAENKKNRIQAEIMELLNNSQNISAELKQEYSDKFNSVKADELRLKEKQNEYDQAKDRVLRIKEAIARKQGAIDGSQDETQKEQFRNDITGLNDKLHSAEEVLNTLSSEINSLKSSISKKTSGYETILKKIESTDKNTADKIREKQLELVQTDENLQTELSSIEQHVIITERLQLEMLRQSASDSTHYQEIANGTVGSDGTIGKTAAQALANATGEIGVRESTGHNDGAQIAKYRNGVDNNAAWCASFVSWCYKGNDVFGYQPSVSGIQMAAQRQNLYAQRDSYTPKPGDVMIQKNGASHTGIVESVDPDGTIHTIEGNSSNSVRRRTYKPGSKGYNTISGWVKMS